MLQGYRTILVGLAMAVMPAALTYLAGVDWSHFFGPATAFFISGAITITMRFFTRTPPGKSAEQVAIDFQSSMGVGLAIIGAGLALLCVGPARAADLAVKAAPAAFSYPAGNGFYVFVGTEGGKGNGDAAGEGVSTTSIDVHGGAGYVWSIPGSAMFVNAQARAGWSNFSGSAGAASFSGPLAFEERVTLGAPTDQILAVMPSLFGGITPPPFVAPAGQTVVSSKWYVGATLDERDISLNYGQASNKVWALAPGVVFGIQHLMSSGTMADTFAKVRFDDKSVCVGAPVAACGSVGTAFLAGIDLKWGL